MDDTAAAVSTEDLSMLTRSLYDPVQPVETLLDALSDRAREFTDTLVPADHLRMNNAGDLVIRNRGSSIPSYEAHDIQPQALQLIARRLRIPHDYLVRCPSDLRAQNVNHWLSGLGDKELLVRKDGRAIRAVLSAAYTPLDNLPLLQFITSTMKDVLDHCHARWEWTRTHFLCQILLPEDSETSQKVVGSVVRGGLMVKNSETGFAAISLRAMLYRLICTNGMVAPAESVSFRKIHRTDPDKLCLGILDVLKRVPDWIGDLIERLRRTGEQQLANPAEEIETIIRSRGLVNGTADAVREAYREEPGYTRAHLIHALSRAGNDARLTFTQREELQHLAGAML